MDWESDWKGIIRDVLGIVFTNEIGMQNHKIKCFSLQGNSFGFLAFIWHFIATALHHCSRGSNTSKTGIKPWQIKKPKINYISEHLS